MSPRSRIFVSGEVLLSPLSVGVGRLLAGDFLEKRRHVHTLGDKTRPSNMHGDQKLASRIVDTRDLPHVDFDFLA
jgi:hypothetical protein